MAGTVTDSRVRNGQLILGGLDASTGEEFSCPPTAVSLEPDVSTSGDPIETLCGATILPSTTETWSLNFTAIQDFTDPDGLLKWAFDNSLLSVPFLWRPNTVDAPDERFTGIVQVQSLTIGGDVNARNTSDATWPLEGKPTWELAATPPAATGATAGTPGTWTPGGATPPADFAGMAGIVATPATAWSGGEYVELGDASHAYWDGSAWQVGQAP
jgi:hypothetical protein